MNLGQLNAALEGTINNATIGSADALFSAAGDSATESAQASGAHAIAAGANARASGVNTVAEGANAEAAGTNAIAVGANAQASGTNAASIGANAIVSATTRRRSMPQPARAPTTRWR
ncbi:hypothetical protein HDG38_002182 [Paraburkholderia sp. WSM4177]|nr:hypothetical protein [Paraburkholderia sp. WSM4177]MBB5484208.1 hypothetical protein [Paraburkholderia sp. WSM4180]